MDNIAVDALILRVAAGDMSALEELYNGLADMVYGFAMTIVKNPAVAEDIRQDVFVKIYNGAGSFKSSGFGKSWIMMITRNLSLNAVSRGVTEPEDALVNMQSGDNTEQSAIINLTLRRALERLSDDERRIVTLHALSGLRLNQIADIMDMPLGTVKWKHSKALKQLKSEFGEE